MITPAKTDDRLLGQFVEGERRQVRSQVVVRPETRPTSHVQVVAEEEGLFAGSNMVDAKYQDARQHLEAEEAPDVVVTQASPGLV